jgi:hypothetical protein
MICKSSDLKRFAKKRPRLVEVRTQQSKTNYDASYTHVDALVFEDGTVMSFLVAEEADDYGIEAQLFAPKTSMDRT